MQEFYNKRQNLRIMNIEERKEAQAKGMVLYSTE
jgi:hypothetical protein